MEYVPKYLKKISHSENIIYRGHADCDWELKPSIGRHYHGAWSEVLKWEIKSLDQFKKRSVPYLKARPNTDIDWLCLMQHHGCATRLLDFTNNPLIALFFASDPIVDKDGEIIIAKYGHTYENVNDETLFKRTHSFAYYPPHITERIVGQLGCFVYANKPNIPLNDKEIERVKVIKAEKGNIRLELRELGISYSSLFPGMDGLCQDLNENLILNLELEGL